MVEFWWSLTICDSVVLANSIRWASLWFWEAYNKAGGPLNGDWVTRYGRTTRVGDQTRRKSRSIRNWCGSPPKKVTWAAKGSRLEWTTGAEDRWSSDTDRQGSFRLVRCWCYRLIVRRFWPRRREANLGDLLNHYSCYQISNIPGESKSGVVDSFAWFNRV